MTSWSRKKAVDCHISFEVMIMKVKDCWVYGLGYKPPNVMISKFKGTFTLLCQAIIKETPSVVNLGEYDYDD